MFKIVMLVVLDISLMFYVTVCAFTLQDILFRSIT